MKKMAFATAAAVAAFVAAPASAATNIDLNWDIGGTLVGVFGNLNPSGSHTDHYTFTVPSDGNVFADVGSAGLWLTLTNLDFTSVTLNGVAFTNKGDGVFEFRDIWQNISAGEQFLDVSYKNAQALSSYGGKIVFFPSDSTGAVPEPATWALMILGFGMVAGAMRYRRRETKVRFA